MVATVFQVIPDTVDTGYQFIPDLLVFVYDIIRPAGKLNPPVTVIYGGSTEGGHSHICLVDLALDLRSMYCGVRPVFQLLLGKGSRKIRFCELHRVSSVHCLEQ